jgi:hypothetical protein
VSLGLGIRRLTASFGFPQASGETAAPTPRTWFDTCPGPPATQLDNIYQYLADIHLCWIRTWSWSGHGKVRSNIEFRPGPRLPCQPGPTSCTGDDPFCRTGWRRKVWPALAGMRGIRTFASRQRPVGNRVAAFGAGGEKAPDVRLVIVGPLATTAGTGHSGVSRHR